jgi:hypothetical protein
VGGWEGAEVWTPPPQLHCPPPCHKDSLGVEGGLRVWQSTDSKLLNIRFQYRSDPNDCPLSRGSRPSTQKHSNSRTKILEHSLTHTLGVLAATDHESVSSQQTEVSTPTTTHHLHQPQRLTRPHACALRFLHSPRRCPAPLPRAALCLKNMERC